MSHMAGNKKKSAANTIEGVFSSRDKGRKQYWLVKETGGGSAEVQPINERLAPTGAKRNISLGELLEGFEPEPEFYVDGALKSETPEPEKPAAPRKGVTLDLEGFELSGSAEEVEKSARAAFGMALAHLKRGNRTKARRIFENLAGSEAGFQRVHKHMFNDFGISLRREHLPETAIKLYSRALSLASDDPHLHFNMARVLYEDRNFTEANSHLERALQLDPELMEARMFLEYIRRKRRKNADKVRIDD
jgi:tetratricopeptide (TPR) repeat protein